jgi:hypothetical protein
MPQVWIHSSQSLALLYGLPDLLVGLAGGLGQDGVVEHLGEVGHPAEFVR